MSKKGWNRLMIGCWIHYTVDDPDIGERGLFVLKIQKL